MRFPLTVLASTLFLAPALRAGDTPPQPTDRVRRAFASPIDDAALEERKKTLTEGFGRRAALIEQNFKRRQEFETQFKDAKLSFEKMQVDEQVAFIGTLKSLSPADRGFLLDRLNEKQADERKAFRAQWRERLRTSQEQALKDLENFREEARKSREYDRPAPQISAPPAK
ncbi:MAG: hypothetical protein IPP68_07795 [Elusimicrobia bacterium]|nr:hypothetical protein [Elusimicrobiota bacterium]